MYEGQWDQGKMQGKGKFTWKPDCFYEGDYLNDLKHGYGEFHFSAECSWKVRRELQRDCLSLSLSLRWGLPRVGVHVCASGPSQTAAGPLGRRRRSRRRCSAGECWSLGWGLQIACLTVVFFIFEWRKLRGHGNTGSKTETARCRLEMKCTRASGRTEEENAGSRARSSLRRATSTSFPTSRTKST